MKLGHAFEFDIPVKDVSRSAAFYESLGFVRTERAGARRDARRLTDGLVVIALRPDGGEGAGLTYYTDDVDAILQRLRALGVKTKAESAGNRTSQVQFADPSGLRLTIARGLRTEAPPLAGRAQSKLGQFGELSLEVADVDHTAAFWRGLGYEPTQYSPGAGAGWESLSDGLLMVGIYGKGHTKHLFKSPVITYFNEDAPQRIQQLKAEGMTFVEEIGTPGAPREAVAQAPDGQMLFLFGAG